MNVYLYYICVLKTESFYRNKSNKVLANITNFILYNLHLF